MSPAALPFTPSAAATPRVPGICRICGYPRTDDFWFAESDLCGVCHGPQHPTRAQLAEIRRIESRKGPGRVTRGRGRYDLELTLTAHEYGPAFHVRPAVLTIDRRGRVVHWLPREVSPRDLTAASRR